MDKKYGTLKEFQVVKFQDRLNSTLNTLKSKGINISIPELKQFHIEVTDNIEEEKMQKVILENIKTAYSPYTRTIYIHESFKDASQLEYHFTKRMLEHLSTKVEQEKVLSGISISGNNINYNYSLNNAIIESITNTLLGNETIDEDTFSKYIIERHHLGLIENIVGLETIMNSFFNADYMLFESKFEEYGSKFHPLAVQMDTLTTINYNPQYIKKESDEKLALDIFTKILDAYTRKSSKTKNINRKDDFENHIINRETVRGAFGTSEKFGYKDVNKNLETFKSVIKGLESANKLIIENKEPARSI